MNGSLLIDDVGKQVRLLLSTVFVGQVMGYESIGLANAAYTVSNDQCRPAKAYYSNWFSWIALAPTKFKGTRVLPSGLTCNVWTLPISATGFLEVCADAQWPYTFLIVGTANPLNMPLTNQMATMSSTPVVPKQCLGPPPVCPQSPWAHVKLFRLHNVNDTQLAQRNFGTIVGDLYYICSAIQFPNSPIVANDTVVSQFDIYLNATWGQYALCNHNECVGGDNATVGHEATSGFTPFGGQCSMHTAIGDWFSLTQASMCGANATVPSTACAWQLQKRVKSVAMPCLVNNGLVQACASDLKNGGFPFRKSADLVTQAMGNNMLSPDTPPPPTVGGTRAKAQQPAVRFGGSRKTTAVDDLFAFVDTALGQTI